MTDLIAVVAEEDPQAFKQFFLSLLNAGTKTLVVHGQNECDIPTQLPVHEDTQFEALLKVKQGFLRVKPTYSLVTSH